MVSACSNPPFATRSCGMGGTWASGMAGSSYGDAPRLHDQHDARMCRYPNPGWICVTIYAVRLSRFHFVLGLVFVTCTCMCCSLACFLYCVAVIPGSLQRVCYPRIPCSFLSWFFIAIAIYHSVCCTGFLRRGLVVCHIAIPTANSPFMEPMVHESEKLGFERERDECNGNTVTVKTRATDPFRELETPGKTAGERNRDDHHKREL